MIFIFFKILNILKEYKKNKNQLHFTNYILENISVPWCVWDINKTLVETSHTFSKLLNFDPQKIITIEDIFKKLNAGTFSPLSKAVNHLLEFGGLFNVQVTLEEKQKEVKFFGQALQYEYEGNRKNIIIFTVLDITKTYEQETNTQNLINHLKSENEMLHFLANESPLALWHRNNQGGIHYCNKSYAGALSVSVSKAVAESLELISSRQVNLHELSKQALIHSEKMIARAHTVIDGHRRLLELAEIPMKDSGTTIGYAMDITEIEDLELKIKNTTKAYRDMLDALSIPIAVFDEERHINFYNLAYQQLFEFSFDFLAKKPTLSEVLDDLRRRRKIQEYSSFQEHKKERNTLFNDLLSPIEEISYLPDGKTLRIRISPYPLGGVLFIFENITSQLVLERDVNTLQAVQKTTIDHLHEGIIVIGNDGKIRLFNPAVLKIWAIDTMNDQDSHIQQWLSSISHMFLNEEQHQNWQQQLAKRFSERHPISEKLYLINGSVIEWFYVPLPDASHLLGFIDVSEVWHHEQQLKSRNLNLELIQKLKTNYIDEIKGELMPSLNDILGFSSILNSQVFGEVNEKQQDYIKLINNKTENLQTLLYKVFELIQLDFDHIELQKEETNLKTFFNSLEEDILQKANDHEIECQIKNLLKKEQMMIDQKRLYQAYLGLVVDHLKRIPKDGKIAITISVDKIKNHLMFEFFYDESSHITTKSNTLNFGYNIANIVLKNHSGGIESKKEDDLLIITTYIPF
ncbi:MAG: PAS-domain containing protein [Proteobacteria bacterium]|nr:PAS-domain containing protein [Pseudomonadota bacterium]